MNKMAKRSFLILVVATFWLVNGLFCFCEKGITGSFASEKASACSGEPFQPTSESGDDDCCVCCGHLVFISGNFVNIVHHFIQQEFSLQSLVFSDQFSFRSIDHPPKA